jgi:hypothetical protein
MTSFWTFWFPCFLMGFGIAVDVIIATVSQFRNKSLSVKSWSLPIAGTHILFPAFGYYGFWYIQQTVPGSSLILGLIGFTLVTLFVYEVFCEAAGIEPVFAISERFSKLVGLKEEDARLIIAILAVSWDALWSGPAKAAQTAEWTNPEVFWSFFVAGAAVFVFAQVALIIAFWMRKQQFHNAIGMGRFTFWGKYTELSVIGGFGILSLWSGITGDGNIYGSIGIAAIIMLVLFQVYEEKIAENEIEEAEEAITA